MDGKPLYRDQKIKIFETPGGEDLACVWHGDEELNQNYMEAKLSEYVGNNYAGSWPVQEKAEVGMRCFKLEWQQDILHVRWVK